MLKKSIIISLAILLVSSAGACDRMAAQLAARYSTTKTVIYSAARNAGIDLKTGIPAEKATLFRVQIETLKSASKVAVKTHFTKEEPKPTRQAYGATQKNPYRKFKGCR